MLERTHIPEAPWWIVEAVDKKKARLNCIHHLLGQILYQEVRATADCAAATHASPRPSAPANPQVNDMSPMRTEAARWGAG